MDHSTKIPMLSDQQENNLEAVMPVLPDDEICIKSTCPTCNKVLRSNDPGWPASVSITPDTLFVGMAAEDLGEAIIDKDVAYDFCNVRCFGKFVMSALELFGATSREDD